MIHAGTNEFMKISSQIKGFAKLSIMVLLAGACSIGGGRLLAMEPGEGAQRSFASPNEAIKALQAAAESKDKTALSEIFGPQLRELSTGDKVHDANDATRFANAMAQGCTPVKDGADRIILEVGTNNWPMPIPLVQAEGQWRFDTAAGKEEIINRHIGQDELEAIGVCRDYVTAQEQHARANPEATAQKFKSTTGMHDGLYWVAADNEPASPFGPLVAEAHVEGYNGNGGKGPQPFHGYYFRILTRQGEAAPGGKMNYMSGRQLTGGFALVAYPERWDQSGIMTFIVNQDGKVFQRNLGKKTSRVAGSMKAYNPSSDWTLEQDRGVLNGIAEQ